MNHATDGGASVSMCIADPLTASTLACPCCHRHHARQAGRSAVLQSLITWLISRSSLTSSSSHSATNVQHDVVKRRARRALCRETTANSSSTRTSSEDNIGTNFEGPFVDAVTCITPC